MTITLTVDPDQLRAALSEALRQVPAASPAADVTKGGLSSEAAIILHEIQQEIIKQNSPWLGLQEAAAYAGGVSVSSIVKVRNQGKLKEHFLPGILNPLFRKDEIDKLIQSGWKPKVRRGPRKAV